MCRWKCRVFGHGEIEDLCMYQLARKSVKYTGILTNDVPFEFPLEANGGHEGQSSLRVDRSGEVIMP